MKFGVTPGGGGNIPGGLTGAVADIVELDQSKPSGEAHVYDENMHIFARKTNGIYAGQGIVLIKR